MQGHMPTRGLVLLVIVLSPTIWMMRSCVVMLNEHIAVGDKGRDTIQARFHRLVLIFNALGVDHFPLEVE